jgi:hypothetical protein
MATEREHPDKRAPFQIVGPPSTYGPQSSRLQGSPSILDAASRLRSQPRRMIPCMKQHRAVVARPKKQSQMRSSAKASCRSAKFRTNVVGELGLQRTNEGRPLVPASRADRISGSPLAGLIDHGGAALWFRNSLQLTHSNQTPTIPASVPNNAYFIRIDSNNLFVLAICALLFLAYQKGFKDGRRRRQARSTSPPGSPSSRCRESRVPSWYVYRRGVSSQKLAKYTAQVPGAVLSLETSGKILIFGSLRLERSSGRLERRGGLRRRVPCARSDSEVDRRRRSARHRCDGSSPQRTARATGP